MAPSVQRFPADSDNQTFVTVKALVAGHCWLPDCLAFLDEHDSPDSQGAWVPAFSFLISHPSKGQALFDGWPAVPQKYVSDACDGRDVGKGKAAQKQCRTSDLLGTEGGAAGWDIIVGTSPRAPPLSVCG
ncbi:hypothetical protein NM688_g7284 [Phlebia brevispora]|uniref:Uncharacterized protein n=1 Tax=Phlebia brevispora TaxID=194682 RepID=A0ACC1S7J3_9APHY|nr:hypothetical protein NM688_g7284 [Phlebia brevispora]